MSSTPNVPSVSVIVPIFNEAFLIADFLRRLRRIDPSLQVIVVDAASSDESVALAMPLADTVILAPRARASQMNAGAAIASGEVLWFLHADSSPPADAVEEIRGVLSDPRNAGGCFSLRYPRPEWIYRLSDSVGNIGVKIFGFALGDHGIFCRRSAFTAAGCYPVVPILEDAELYRALGRAGHMVQLPDEIVSDPRAFEKNGRYRTTVCYFVILVLYVLGVPIRSLNKIYRRFLRSRSQPEPSRNGDLESPSSEIDPALVSGRTAPSLPRQAGA